MAIITPEVLQFHVALQEHAPLVWRRIQVPASYTFWDLHVAIQDAMGWLDQHLHKFIINDPATGMEEEFGIPDPEIDNAYDVLADWDYSIADFFVEFNTKALYVYDFGDHWVHELTYEGAFPISLMDYPICMGGEMACPPEDSGGVWGYQEKLEILADTDHEEHQSIKEWMGKGFDATVFDPDQVIFDDPLERKRRLDAMGH